MSEFSVKSAELRNKANMLSQYNSKFKTEKDNLVNAEMTLMKGFEGDAAVTFDTEFKAFEARMENFKNVIDEYVARLNEEAAAYEKADQEARMTAETK